MFGFSKNRKDNFEEPATLAPVKKSLAEQIANSFPELRPGWAWNIEENRSNKSNADYRYVLWLVKVTRFSTFSTAGRMFNNMTPSDVNYTAVELLNDNPKAKPAKNIDSTDREAFGFYASTKKMRESQKETR